MSLLDLNVDELDCFKILCIKHIKAQFPRGVKVVYEESNIDISVILQNPDNYVLGKRWEHIGGFFRIKVLPYKKLAILTHQLKHGYWKDDYLLSIDNLLSVILM